MTNHPPVLTTYALVWNTTDPEIQTRLLQQCWADNGVYCDPATETIGRDALARYISASQGRFPGAGIAITGPVAQHHGRMHFTWSLATPDGRTIVTGHDLLRLAPDGRIAEIVGFFDPPART